MLYINIYINNIYKSRHIKRKNDYNQEETKNLTKNEMKIKEYKENKSSKLGN